MRKLTPYAFEATQRREKLLTIAVAEWKPETGIPPIILAEQYLPDNLSGYVTWQGYDVFKLGSHNGTRAVDMPEDSSEPDYIELTPAQQEWSMGDTLVDFTPKELATPFGRLPDGHYIFTGYTDRVPSRQQYRTSTDGETWGAPVAIPDPPDSYDDLMEVCGPGLTIGSRFTCFGQCDALTPWVPHAWGVLTTDDNGATWQWRNLRTYLALGENYRYAVAWWIDDRTGTPTAYVIVSNAPSADGPGVLSMKLMSSGDLVNWTDCGPVTGIAPRGIERMEIHGAIAITAEHYHVLTIKSFPVPGATGALPTCNRIYRSDNGQTWELWKDIEANPADNATERVAGFQGGQFPALWRDVRGIIRFACPCALAGATWEDPLDRLLEAFAITDEADWNVTGTRDMSVDRLYYPLMLPVSGIGFMGLFEAEMKEEPPTRLYTCIQGANIAAPTYTDGYWESTVRSASVDHPPWSLNRIAAAIETGNSKITAEFRTASTALGVLSADWHPIGGEYEPGAAIGDVPQEMYAQGRFILRSLDGKANPRLYLGEMQHSAALMCAWVKKWGAYGSKMGDAHAEMQFGSIELLHGAWLASYWPWQAASVRTGSVPICGSWDDILWHFCARVSTYPVTDDVMTLTLGEDAE